jgi:hypothetical protein
MKLKYSNEINNLNKYVYRIIKLRKINYSLAKIFRYLKENCSIVGETVLLRCILVSCQESNKSIERNSLNYCIRKYLEEEIEPEVKTDLRRLSVRNVLVKIPPYLSTLHAQKSTRS